MEIPRDTQDNEEQDAGRRKGEDADTAAGQKAEAYPSPTRLGSAVRLKEGRVLPAQGLQRAADFGGEGGSRVSHASGSSTLRP